MLVGAAWLAFRGHKPDEIAARATDAAQRVHRFVGQMEAMGPEIVRRVMQCKAPMQPCDCLYCQDQARERASSSSSEEKSS